MADYTLQIEALKEAIATGALEVTYDGGRKVKYDSFEMMKARIAYLQGEIAAENPVSGRPSVGFASFWRGDR